MSNINNISVMSYESYEYEYEGNLVVDEMCFS
jgi:hypothetical protein